MCIESCCCTVRWLTVNGGVTEACQSCVTGAGYDEDGRRSDSMFEILYKCSTDAGLVDWVDDGKLTRHAGCVPLSQLLFQPLLQRCFPAPTL